MSLSPAMVAGDSIYNSGQVPTLADGSVVVGGFEAQTRQVIDNKIEIEAIAHKPL